MAVLPVSSVRFNNSTTVNFDVGDIKKQKIKKQL